MSNIQFNQDIYNQLKQDILTELKNRPQRSSLAEQELRLLGRTYGKQLQGKTNTGTSWDYVRRVVTFLLGYRYVRDIPDEKVEEMKKITIELVEKILKAEK